VSNIAPRGSSEQQDTKTARQQRRYFTAGRSQHLGVGYYFVFVPRRAEHTR
jgi:hypothetical protein